LTVGRAADADACEMMLAAARLAFPRALEATLDSLTICTLAADGRVVREYEIGVG